WKARIADWEPGQEVESLLGDEVSEGFSARDGKVRVGSPVLLSESNRAVLAITAPVMADQRTRAIAVGLVDLAAPLARILGEIRTPYTVYATDRQGRPFVHSDPRELRAGASLRDSEIVQRFVTGGGRNSETLHFTARGPDGNPEALIGSYEQSGQDWGIF